MDGTSPFLDPRFLLPLILAAIAFIAWLVRLEYKTNANTSRQAEHEEGMDERMTKAEGNTDRLKAAFYSHASDTAVHHNEKAFSEFRERLKERFENLDAKLGEIKSLLINRK